MHASVLTPSVCPRQPVTTKIFTYGLLVGDRILSNVKTSATSFKGGNVMLHIIHWAVCVLFNKSARAWYNPRRHSFTEGGAAVFSLACVNISSVSAR